jgi:hypothetical protein
LLTRTAQQLRQASPGAARGHKAFPVRDAGVDRRKRPRGEDGGRDDCPGADLANEARTRLQKWRA